ncbi:GNAT family N-acetyltransferase [Pseudomonas vancouverensis]|uniref:GNAT family N-acetyltransferase n=1 Tax=Pseudomonas vancouverensis TaxID=95300 RepID=UPI003D047C2D
MYRSRARKIAEASASQLQQSLERGGPTALDFSKVHFEPIDARALKAFEHWDDPHFSWNEVIGWKTREPLALDIAIWYEDELCGLCFVNPNNSRQRIRIVRLEGRPNEPHPLRNRIATLAMIAIEQYAFFLGCQIIEVQEPNEGAVSIYLQLGFEFDSEGRLVKTLENLVS